MQAVSEMLKIWCFRSHSLLYSLEHWLFKDHIFLKIMKSVEPFPMKCKTLHVLPDYLAPHNDVSCVKYV